MILKEELSELVADMLGTAKMVAVSNAPPRTDAEAFCWNSLRRDVKDFVAVSRVQTNAVVNHKDAKIVFETLRYMSPQDLYGPDKVAKMLKNVNLEVA